MQEQLSVRVRETVVVARALVGWLRGRLPGRVQQMGDRALSAVAARWPMLGALLDSVVASEPGDAQAARSPVARVPVPAARPVPLGVSMQELLLQLERAGDWQERVRAATSLADSPHEAALRGLVRALRDPNADVAVAVVEALACRRQEQANAALLEVVRNPEGYFHPVARVAAIAALVNSSERAELGPVFAAVHDVSAEVSVAAIAAIAARAPEQIDSLVQVLSDDSGFFAPTVRLAAARALERTQALSRATAEQGLVREQDLQVRSVLDRVLRSSPAL